MTDAERKARLADQHDKICESLQHHGKKNVLYDLGFENLGCRSPDKYSKYFGTTAGILCAIRPCGIIADWTEMLRAESVTLWIHLIGWNVRETRS